MFGSSRLTCLELLTAMGAFGSHEEDPTAECEQTAQMSSTSDLQQKVLPDAFKPKTQDTRVSDSLEQNPTATGEWAPDGDGNETASSLFCGCLCPCLHVGEGDVPTALQINSTEGIPFETDFFSGHILFMHRPDPEPESWAWREFFEGKARCWEFRLQGKFKTNPGEMYFAAELSEPMSIGWASIMTMQAILSFASMLASIKGIVFDYNWYLTKLDNGDILRPHFTFPLVAADVVVRTPAGQQPPLISAPLETTPLADKIATTLNVGDTYTFGFWTKYIDFVRWELVNVPLGLGGRLDTFIGKQPVDLTIYRLRTSNSDGDLRAESNKDVLARIALMHSANGRETIDSIRPKLDVQNSAASAPAIATGSTESRNNRQHQQSCCFPLWQWLMAKLVTYASLEHKDVLGDGVMVI